MGICDKILELDWPDQLQLTFIATMLPLTNYSSALPEWILCFNEYFSSMTIHLQKYIHYVPCESEDPSPGLHRDDG